MADHASTNWREFGPLGVVDELVLSQEDQPQIHCLTRSTAQSAVARIIFSPLSWFEETPTEDLTEAIHYV